MEPSGAAYHVFINHRGSDVKRTLASLIYHRLTHHGLRVFFDKEEIHPGDVISSAIEDAIQSTSVYIAIFSQNYAKSSWCLNEMRLIWRSYRDGKSKIIPVFCDVEPEDVRYVKNWYAFAFEEHRQKGRVSEEIMEEWKTALKEVSLISGLVFKTESSDEGEFLERIVEIVLQEMAEREPFDVAEHPAGLDQAAEDFQNEILGRGEPNTTMIVGIAGMGGIGKSTLATHLYKLRRSEFRRSSFLSDVSKTDLRSLQGNLFRDLLGYDFRIKNTIHGKGILRDRLRGLQVLIVLDDVDHIDQINSLLVPDAVGSGSLILITSRNKDLFRCSSVKILVYDVKLLQAKYARELFCRHAFGQSEPSEGFEDLVEGFLKICGGLPLSLKVMGGQFVGRCDKEYWEKQLGKFSRTLLPDDVMNRLKVSYETLKDEEKQMFLDVGCFFVGEDTELAVRVFEGLDYNDVQDCLESLHQKCLVGFQELCVSESYLHSSLKTMPSFFDFREEIVLRRDHCQATVLPKGGYKLTMHDQIRKLARQISREEFRAMFKPLRVCCSNDVRQMLLLLKYRSDSFELRGIHIPQSENDARKINIGITDVRAHGLKFLATRSKLGFSLWDLTGDLVWLRLHDFDRSSFPPTISLRSLRVLELWGLDKCLEELFSKVDDPPEQLSELNIGSRPEQLSELNIGSRDMQQLGIGASSSSQSFDLQEHFTKFSGKDISIDQKAGHPLSYLWRFLEWIGTKMIKLEKLGLHNFHHLLSLPMNFGELKKLTYLNLSGCTNLTRLPKSFSQLLQLQYLILRDCSNLYISLHILGEICTLEYIDFKGCVNLVHLPLAVASQRSLRYLNLLDTGIVSMALELPENLEHLRIGNTCLKEVSLSVNGWTKLKELILVRCQNLKSIDAPIEKFTHLEKLLINESAAHILPGVAALEAIKFLAIEDCPITKFSFQYKTSVMDVQVLRMNFLKDLTLKNTSISELYIPQSACPGLETLDLSKNIQLMRVEGLPSTLVSLNLQDCSTLKTLMIHSNLVHLKFMNINRCHELEILDVEGLRSLEEIRADECWKLRRIEALIQLERLNCFHISTDNAVIWSDICKLLTSPPQLATAAFSREGDGDMINDEKIATWISDFERVTVLDAPEENAVAPSLKLVNVHSHGAILMCFITCKPSQFYSVWFYQRDDRSGFKVYQTSAPSYQSSDYNFMKKRKLHVFMWTEDSKLFEDGYNCADLNGSDDNDSVDGPHAKKGWIFMLKRKTDVFKLCKQILSTVK